MPVPILLRNVKRGDDEKNSSASIVVYFSATGNTRRVAEEIAEATDSALAELIPGKAYTDEDLNFNEESNRVVQEYENPDQRNNSLSNEEIPDWQQYDTVYLGYPIWWSQAAWPIDDFVKDNSFIGKTVFPFCTSLSSPAGSSAEELEKMADGGNWHPAKRFSEIAGNDEVQSWLNGIQ